MTLLQPGEEGSSAYAELEARFDRLGAIKDAIGILHWDAQTNMPPASADSRSDQIAVLKGIAHQLLAGAETRDCLDSAEQAKETLDPWQVANLREMRRSHLHAAAIPPDLVEASSRAVSRAEMIWREARRTSDFDLLLPHLAAVLDLQRAIAVVKGEALSLAPYDALLDAYDPGLRRATIDPLFAELRSELPSLIEDARTTQESLPASEALSGPFPVEKQRKLADQLLHAVGFDFDRGRLDVSPHPFCGGASSDVRITTRYDERDLAGALMSVLHEAGHALYEQGRPRAWLKQPVGAARGMTLHESQALIIEMQACRSFAFISFLAPLVRAAFGGEGEAWGPENLHRLSTRVEQSLIRVEADEITYPAHILVRYKLETAMISGDLTVAELPAAFNAEMRELLHLKVPNDRLGCLQDVHWPSGHFGYFPTYTLGAMVAAQLFEAACQAEPGIPRALSFGDFAPLRSWLSTHIHSKGSLLETDQLLTASTGRPLQADVFRRHLRARYVDRVDLASSR